MKVKVYWNKKTSKHTLYPTGLDVDFFLNLFIYFWLCWVSVSVRGPSPVVASGGHSSSPCAGLSLSRALLLGAQAPDAQAQ